MMTADRRMADDGRDRMKKLKQCSLKIDQVEKKMLALNDAGELEILPPNGGVGA